MFCARDEKKKNYQKLDEWYVRYIFNGYYRCVHEVGTFCAFTGIAVTKQIAFYSS